jgi:GNAT superfamily N-acetyltransferase
VSVRLDNGLEIVIRPIRPSDKPLLADGITRLSPRSARFRFLAPKNRLTSAELRYLTEIDFVDHYALVAERPGGRRLAAVGRWVRDAERPDVAEMAIVVDDPLQRQGLGSALAYALADAARARGIGRFTGTALTENAAAARLFRRLSPHAEIRVEGATYELSAELAAAPVATVAAAPVAAAPLAAAAAAPTALAA